MFSQTFYIYNVLDDIDGEDSYGGDGDMGDANPYGAGGDPYGGGGGGYGGGDPYGESNPSKSVLNLITWIFMYRNVLRPVPGTAPK